MPLLCTLDKIIVDIVAHASILLVISVSTSTLQHKYYGSTMKVAVPLYYLVTLMARRKEKNVGRRDVRKVYLSVMFIIICNRVMLIFPICILNRHVHSKAQILFLLLFP